MPDAPPTAADLLAAALEYAGRGLRVVPLHWIKSGAGEAAVCSCGKDCGNSRGKHPRLGQWQKQASAEPRVVRAWWQQVPLGNVGVALGSGSGVVAIDVDPPGGEAALAALAGGDLPATWEVTTGRGRRLLYAIPDGVELDPKTAAFKDATGNESVRFQGTGGQCVLPPSLHYSGVRYRWAAGRAPADLPAAPMPAWLVRVMTPPPAANWASQGERDAFAPGADFNRRATWDDLLGGLGWKPAGRRGDVTYWTRPGKAGGISATVGHYRAGDGTPALYVFTGSAEYFAAGKCYDLFGAYARAAHGGDYRAAAARLARDGYGTPRPVRGAKPAGNGGEAPEVPAEPDPWPAPLPLDADADAAPPFPLDVLPGPVADYCRAIADAIGCPPDYPAVGALAIASTAIGGAAEVRIHQWTQPAALYCCVVGTSSAKKTPPLKVLLRPVYAHQAARLEALADRSENDNPLRQYGHGEGEVFVSDVTVERLNELLAQQPRGLLLFRHELAGWLAGQNQYKAKGVGADRQSFLEVYDAEPITVHRKNLGARGLSVSHPSLGILGATQPEVVRDFFQRRDGLVERFLWSYPAKTPARREQWRDIDPDLGRRWEGALTNLWAMTMREPRPGHRRPRPHTFPLAAAARPAWEEYTGWLADTLNHPDFPPTLGGSFGKLEGTAARLALVSELLGQACGTSAGGSEVGPAAVAAGATLARYFADHARRVFGVCGADDRLPLAQKVLAWVRAKNVPAFTRSELHVARRSLVRQPEDWAGPLKLLCQFNWLRYEDQPYAGTGRRPTPRFEVNPAAFDEAQTTRKQRAKNPPKSANNAAVELAGAS